MPPTKSAKKKASARADWDSAFKQGAEAAGHSSYAPHSASQFSPIRTESSRLDEPLLTRTPTEVQASKPPTTAAVKRRQLKIAPASEGKANERLLAAASMPSPPKTPGTVAAEEAPFLESFVKSCLYGLINTVVVAPVVVGFAAIIFRHPAFHKDPAVYSQLVKLCLFSSAVHQTAFTCTSSLPFAIGQIQDAGLIFLSKIAGDIATQMSDAPPAHMLATVLVTLSLSTALLGVALIFTGKWKLAGLVQYLPLPVVGGYLAFIGLYCLEAGLSMMSGVQVDSLLGLRAVEQWSALLTPANLYYTLPGVVLGVSILLALHRCHHFLVLPALLLAIPIGFYALAFSLGFSLDDLRDIGMVAPAEAAGNPLEVWSLFDFAHVRWELVPSALPTWLGMYVVVAFSSSLDVAAIQMDMGRQLDFNHELVTVGLSNLLSGLSGGFTGSYIFSQTLFTFRTGNRSRVCGSFVLTAEILLFLAPFSMVSYVPKLFFGSVLTFIAADLMLDWLWLSRHKVHPIEYLVILTTFLGINLLGLELGMCLGLLVAMVSFIYDYARVPVVQRVKLRSSVIRSLPLSALLADQQEQIITLRCRGYIFFGSTIQIMDSVMRSVVLPPSEPPLRGGSGSASVGVWRTDSGGAGGRRTNSGSDGGWSDDGEAALFGEGSGHCGSGYQPPTLPTDFCGGEVGGPAVDGASSASSFALVGSGGSSGGSDTGTDASSQPTTRFVLFDFSAVSGLDATAARSCFLNLTRTLAPLGITVAFGGVREGSHTERLLIGHEILNVRPPNPSAMRFDTIDEALEHCEEELLKASSPQGVATPGLGLSTSSQRRSQSSGNLTGGGGGEAGGLAAGGAAPMCASPSGGRFAVGGRERSQRAAAMPGWQPSDRGGAMTAVSVGVGVPGGGLPGAMPPGHTVAPPETPVSSAGGGGTKYGEIALCRRRRGGNRRRRRPRKLRGPSLSSRPHSVAAVALGDAPSSGGGGMARYPRGPRALL